MPRREQAAADAVGAAATARRERDELVAGLARHGAALGIVARDLAGIGEAAAGAAVGARRDHDALERDLAERTALELALATAQREITVADELGRRLSARGFERWLVEEALRALVVDASATLDHLSAGAYSLTVADDGDFMVVDHHNADETRSVRTLSGGETFQASLALALALAEQLAELAADGAARLDAIFLDEGFGALDTETLDTVAATIETLGTSGRMVGIVTHVRELAERVPVRFEVRKVGNTSEITRVDA
jgi:exonuclease SbcC